MRNLLTGLACVLCVEVTAYATPSTTTTTLPRTSAECHAEVDSDPRAYCEGYAQNYCGADAEARATTICGDALAVCGDTGQLALQVAVTKNKCDQSNYQSLRAAQQCGDSLSICESNIEMTTQNCNPALICPDFLLQAGCAKYKTKVKRNRAGKVVSKEQKCVKYFTPILYPTE